MAQDQEDTVAHCREEIIRLLLSAGYFRVRMPDLDDFDKVAGGLAWALKSSSVDVDVDIFFKEKPNIGEKIKISESICAGLVKSKCPFPLAAYQIQGLDFPKLFPIIQWLVKLVIATRNEFGDFQRSYAEFAFNNRYANLPSDVLIQEHSHASRSNIRDIERFFPPKRMYKRSDWDSSKPELKQIETTLLEYGRVPTLVMRQVKPGAAAVAAQQATASATASVAPRQVNSKFAAAAAAVSGKLAPGNAAAAVKPKEPTEEELQKINEERQKEMRDTIKKMVKTDADISIDGATFAALINNEEDIVAQKAKRELEHLNAVPENKITEFQLREPHEQKMQALNEELDSFKTEGRKIKIQYDESHAKLEEITELYNAASDQNTKIKRQIVKCNKIIEESQHTDDLLRAISVKDDTQRNYEIFKNQCISEMKEWQEKIEKLKEIQNSGDVDNSSMISNTLEQLEHNWEQKQSVLAEKERDLLKLRIDYDQVPTNAELTQYDKRLNELAMLGEQKVNEQKKCKQLLDALVSSQEVLGNENELFNSILKQFNKAVNDQKLQTKLLDHMDSISRKTGERKKTVTEELKQKGMILSEKDDTHRMLQENQRKYFQTIKEFQQACDELTSLRGEEE